MYFKEFGDEPHFEMPDGRKGWRKYRISSRDLDKHLLGIETIYYIINADGSELRLVNKVVGHYHFASDIESLNFTSWIRDRSHVWRFQARTRRPRDERSHDSRGA